MSKFTDYLKDSLKEYNDEEIEKYSSPEDKKSKELFNKAMEQANIELTHEGDGPVDKFVILSRALDLARQNKFPSMRMGMVGNNDPLLETLASLLNIN